MPPVIGWTIATNNLTLEPITFFLIIFFWTPSHFWALSSFKADDYKSKYSNVAFDKWNREYKKKYISILNTNVTSH